MKANELVKKEKSLDDIYESIKIDNNAGCFKTCIPHYIYVSDETRLKLIHDGFKVYNGRMFNDDCLIIEW